jgi:hypothetical protein
MKTSVEQGAEKVPGSALSRGEPTGAQRKRVFIEHNHENSL